MVVVLIVEIAEHFQIKNVNSDVRTQSGTCIILTDRLRWLQAFRGTA